MNTQFSIPAVLNNSFEDKGEVKTKVKTEEEIFEALQATKGEFTLDFTRPQQNKYDLPTVEAPLY